jgi:ABC-type nickel/cobalt efflux system permease component RcnA
MNDQYTLALMLAAATVGALHTLAPDHWVPFAALARARKWSPLRTARVTFLCGFGHVTVSALLGILGVFIGIEAVHRFGSTLEGNASLLLIGFGLAYMTWGLWRSFRGRIMHRVDHVEGVPHDHGHGHHHHHRSESLTAWSLFVFFCLDPCVAVLPMIIAASSRGWGAVIAVVVVYEIATIGTMLVLVSTAHAGARAVRMPWLDRYGDAVAGALIVFLGALVSILGI